MAAFMKPFAPQAYAVMRIIFGLLFMSHGLSKLFGYPVASPPMPAPLIYVAAAIELVGGALVAIGLMTRWAAFVCSGMMAAAYWMAHGMLAFHPLANHGETAILYCFAFLYIAAHGPGIWSADR
jgi:putative oxidoreductase